MSKNQDKDSREFILKQTSDDCPENASDVRLASVGKEFIDGMLRAQQAKEASKSVQQSK